MLEKTVGEFVRREKECGRVSSRIFFPIDLSFTEGIKYLIKYSFGLKNGQTTT